MPLPSHPHKPDSQDTVGLSPCQLTAWGLLEDRAPADNLPAPTHLLRDGAEQLVLLVMHLPVRLCRVVSPSVGGKGVRENRKRWREVRCHVRVLKCGPVELDDAGSSQGLSSWLRHA